MRATRALTGSIRPSTCSAAVWPSASATTSSGATAASSSSRDRSTISTMRASTATRSPGCARRCETRPEIGATSVPSARALRASSTAAIAARWLACAAASLDTEVSNPVGEMKPCATSARLFSSVRLAMSSCARADEAVCSAWRSRQSSSVVSSWPSTWPALTRSPSRTLRLRNSAATLALTSALFTAFSPPDTSSVRPSATERATTTSDGARSSASVERAEGAAAACSALRASSARATSAPTTSSTSSGMIHFRWRFMRGSAQRGPHRPAGRRAPVARAGG